MLWMEKDWKSQCFDAMFDLWSLGGGKQLFVQLKKKENSLIIALSNKENSGNQWISENEHPWIYLMI